MIIDAHQHFWRLDRGDYDWLTPDFAQLYRDFSPGDLADSLNTCGVEGTVLVQAAPTEAETVFMFGLAQETPWVLGVVGWVDMSAADAPDRLAALVENGWGLLKGVRPMVENIADPEWLLHRDLDPAFQALVTLGLTFDALITPQHLPYLYKRVMQYPDLKVVINHAAKPSIRSGGHQNWLKAMTPVAQHKNVWCKLSGLLTEAPAQDFESVRPYSDDLIALFGPDRLMWGSDWPVLNMATNYERWFNYAHSLVADLDSEAQSKIFGHTAQKFYGL